MYACKHVSNNLVCCGKGVVGGKCLNPPYKHDSITPLDPSNPYIVIFLLNIYSDPVTILF